MMMMMIKTLCQERLHPAQCPSGTHLVAAGSNPVSDQDSHHDYDEDDDNYDNDDHHHNMMITPVDCCSSHRV